jgi:multicomponent Na+:H+ antiporter subunit A
MRHSLILSWTARVIYRPAIVFALYLLDAGHNRPGGGFVGGLVAGIAISLRFVAGGVAEIRNAVRTPAWMPLGVGLTLASATSIAPMLFGGAVLESEKYEWSLPVFGTVKTTTALPFDIGVFLVVVGLVLMMFEAFGEPPTDSEGTSMEDRP